MTAIHLPHLLEAEYFHIENALMATAKGRYFLRTFLERNRGVEVQKLLRSISRLHRVTAGEPGFAVNLHRDLIAVLSEMRHLRQAAAYGTLGIGFEQLEASLTALTEAVEDRCDTARGLNNSGVKGEANDRETKLVNELACLFSPNGCSGSASQT